MLKPFYTVRTAYTYVNPNCNKTTNRTYGQNMTAYSPAFNFSCGGTNEARECSKKGEPFVYSISDLAQQYISQNPGTLNNYDYLTLPVLTTAQVGTAFGSVRGIRYTSCGTTLNAGSADGLFKIDYGFYTAPGYQQKPPTGLFVIPPSISRKMAKPLTRKALLRSVARAAPAVAFVSSLYDAAQLAQAALDDAPTPNNLQSPAPPSGNLKLMLASEPTETIVPGGDNKNRQMPGVTYLDTDIITNNLYQVTQIDWDSTSDVADISDEMKWLLQALGRGALAVLDAFARDFPGAMSDLADIISGVITDSQKAAGKILSELAKEIIAQLYDDGNDGLPDDDASGALDYDLLAQAIRDGVSEALAEYNPPAPPPSQTVIDISSNLEQKLDQYFTISDTEAGLAETISTNGFIFNPGYIP